MSSVNSSRHYQRSPGSLPKAINDTKESRPLDDLRCFFLFDLESRHLNDLQEEKEPFFDFFFFNFEILEIMSI